MPPKLDSQTEIKQNIEKNKAIIVHGSSGIGKTRTIRQVAQILGFKILSVDASTENPEESLSMLLASCVSKGFVNTIYLFEQADNMREYGLIEEIIKSSVNPVVLEANDYKRIPYGVRSLCKLVKFSEPSLFEVVKIVKSSVPHGIEADFRNVTSDIRQSVINTVNASESYKNLDYFKAVETLMTKGILEDELRDDKNLFLWVLDNIPRFYYGLDLVEAVEILAQASKFGKQELLTLLPRGRGTVTFPDYFRLLSNSRKK